MNDKRYIMKIPGLDNFKSLTASVEDMKQQVNNLQNEKILIRESLNTKQEQINSLILEIERIEKHN